MGTNAMTTDTFEAHGIKIPYRRRNGNVKTVCPNCKTTGRAHPEDKSLSVNLDEGLWHCHYCGWSGRLKGYEGRVVKARRQYNRPKEYAESGLSQKLINYFSLRGISIETLKLMHIAEGAEFMPQVGREMNTVQFPYYLDGDLVNIKYRTGDKKFKLYHGAELIPYNIDGIKDKGTAIIVEGEMDALSFIEAGMTNVVSVPNGANKNLEWLDDFLEGWFDDKQTIYIAVDNDVKGTQLKEELIRRFGAERCQVVSWGEGCKDANEQIMAYGKNSLKERIATAKEVKIGGVFGLDDYDDELDKLYYGGGMQKGVTIGHENFDELVSFETKRLMVVTGEPSSGKSEFIDEMCVRINLRYGWKVGYFSPENMPLSYHAVKLLEKIAGVKLEHMGEQQYKNTKFYIRDNFFHILPDEDYSIETILEKAKFLVRRKGIKILVLDPYNRIESTRSDEREFIKVLLRNLTNFAQRNDVLVCLMAHPKKINRESNAEGVPTLNDISGSKDFWNMADFGIIIHRDREEKKVLVRVSKIKYRWLGNEGDAWFKYNIENGRYVPFYEGQPLVMDNKDYLTYGIAEKPQAQPEPMPLQEPQPIVVEDNYDFLTKEKGDTCPF